MNPVRATLLWNQSAVRVGEWSEAIHTSYSRGDAAVRIREPDSRGSDKRSNLHIINPHGSGRARVQNMFEDQDMLKSTPVFDSNHSSLRKVREHSSAFDF